MEAQRQDEDSILFFYKKLIAMRKQCEVIAKGRISFVETGSDLVMAYLRTLGEQQIVAICNLDREGQDIRLDDAWRSYSVLFGNYKDGEKDPAPGKGRYRLRPYEFLALGNIKFQDASRQLFP